MCMYIFNILHFFVSYMIDYPIYLLFQESFEYAFKLKHFW